MHLPIAIIRHELYLSWAWQYADTARLLILDFRDTFFQRDPFESLTLGRPDEPYFQQLLVTEHWPYKRMNNCPHNSGWVRGCWGADAYAPLRKGRSIRPAYAPLLKYEPSVMHTVMLMMKPHLSCCIRFPV